MLGAPPLPVVTAPCSEVKRGVLYRTAPRVPSREYNVTTMTVTTIMTVITVITVVTVVTVLRVMRVMVAMTVMIF